MITCGACKKGVCSNSCLYTSYWFITDVVCEEEIVRQVLCLFAKPVQYVDGFGTGYSCS